MAAISSRGGGGGGGGGGVCVYVCVCTGGGGGGVKVQWRPTNHDSLDDCRTSTRIVLKDNTKVRWDFSPAEFRWSVKECNHM